MRVDAFAPLVTDLAKKSGRTDFKEDTVAGAQKLLRTVVELGNRTFESWQNDPEIKAAKDLGTPDFARLVDNAITSLVRLQPTGHQFLFPPDALAILDDEDRSDHVASFSMSTVDLIEETIERLQEVRQGLQLTRKKRGPATGSIVIALAKMWGAITLLSCRLGIKKVMSVNIMAAAWADSGIPNRGPHPDREPREFRKAVAKYLKNNGIAG